MVVFTALYSGIPEHIDHFKYLFCGLADANGVMHTNLVPWMWTSSILAVISLVLLFVPQFRAKEGLLTFACLAVFFSLWIDKGMGMIIAGLTPNPMHNVTPYSPTLLESLITLAVWGLGGLILTVLYKVVLSVRKDVEPRRYVD